LPGKKARNPKGSRLFFQAFHQGAAVRAFQLSAFSFLSWDVHNPAVLPIPSHNVPDENVGFFRLVKA
jgi:hypothetical protein